ncbi:hypothetical protein [Pseudotabrizicola sediminis]|uniref:hypothetical protein n=1 Tax=Pseudotabrizicola sediminis TaxID=2486418 RepID=UPI003F49B1AA
MTVFTWLNDQLLRMQWLNDLVGAGVAAFGLDPTSRIGGSVQFFVYDVIKIFMLLPIPILRRIYTDRLSVSAHKLATIILDGIA